jgi:hypothetical protein
MFQRCRISSRRVGIGGSARSLNEGNDDGILMLALSNNPINIAFDEWIALGRAVAVARGTRVFGPP